MAQVFIEAITGCQGGDTDPQLLFVYPEGMFLSANTPLHDASSCVRLQTHLRLQSGLALICDPNSWDAEAGRGL